MLVRKAANLGSCKTRESVTQLWAQVLATIFFRPSHPHLLPLSLPPRSQVSTLFSMEAG